MRQEPMKSPSHFIPVPRSPVRVANAAIPIILRLALSLALSRRTGRGNSVAGLLFIFIAASFACAQTITFPTAGQYRPGERMPVTITADGPGLIQLRGENVQGINWPAAGRGSVTVPLTIWRDGPGDLALTLNGKPQTVKLIPLGPDDAPTAELPTDSTADPTAQAARRIVARLADDNSLTAWQPGRPLEQRRWLMLAAIAGTLAVGAVLPWRGRRGAVATVAVSMAVCISIAVLAPSPPARREQPVRGEPGFSEIDYAATRPATVSEPVDRGLWFVPEGDYAALQPTLECSAGGRPVAIRINVPAGGRARFLRAAAG